EPDHAIRPPGRLRQFPGPSRLAHRIVRHELGPDRLDDVQSGRIPRIVLGTVYPRQSAVVADKGLEASAALRKDRVAQAPRVVEMLMAIENWEGCIVHGPNPSIREDRLSRAGTGDDTMRRR